MLFRQKLYNLFLGLILLLPLSATAQGRGGTILNINFGEGKTNPGPPLPLTNTGFTYTTDSCPAPGTYTVTNNLYNCPATRMGRAIDNTPGSNYGYMMVVNDTQSFKSKIVYIDTLKEILCSQTQYQFSAYLLNTAIPGYCSGVNHSPRFTFKVETASGQLIQSSNTGLMPFDYAEPPNRTPKFHFYSVSFYPPPGVNALVLKIEDDPTGNIDCDYSFAIDDIQLTALGPKSEIEFSDAVGTELVRNVCYQDNKNISMTGSVSSGYANTVLQWQQSTDAGLHGQIFPEPLRQITPKLFPLPDTFLFRLSAGDASICCKP